MMCMDYAKVIQDFRSGVLDSERHKLVIDNDGGYWHIERDDDISEEEEDAIDVEIEALEEKYGCPGGYCDVVQILCAAGVPAEWV